MSLKSTFIDIANKLEKVSEIQYEDSFDYTNMLQFIDIRDETRNDLGDLCSILCQLVKDIEEIKNHLWGELNKDQKVERILAIEKIIGEECDYEVKYG